MSTIETQNTGNKNIKIVTIGGGTGNSIMLRGIKEITNNITTIVTVADDGGGSGVLRRDLGMLPPGDIRACLISLANTEPAMEKILQYRFKEGCLKGQSFGNLFLAAMADLYGGFDLGLKEASNVLALTGKVLPMTLENVTLYARLEDGSIIEGESNITFLTRKSGGKIEEVFIKPELPKPMNETVDEIMKADLILIGPGSLYTSIMPNILVDNVAKALRDTKAPIYYATNVMTQAGETDNYSVTDHVNAITKHAGGNIIDKILVNEEEIPELVRLKYYYEQKSQPVYLKPGEKESLEKLGYEVITGPFVDVKYNYIRTDAEKTAEAIFENFSKMKLK